MIATITLHIMAALLLGLTVIAAVATGMGAAENDKEKVVTGVVVTLSLAIITFIVQVVA